MHHPHHHRGEQNRDENRAETVQDRKERVFCSGTNEVVSGTDRADMAENAIAALICPLVSHKQNGPIAMVKASQKSSPCPYQLPNMSWTAIPAMQPSAVPMMRIFAMASEPAKVIGVRMIKMEACADSESYKSATWNTINAAIATTQPIATWLM